MDQSNDNGVTLHLLQSICNASCVFTPSRFTHFPFAITLAGTGFSLLSKILIFAILPVPIEPCIYAPYYNNEQYYNLPYDMHLLLEHLAL